jgi:hypothetical protein
MEVLTQPIAVHKTCQRGFAPLVVVRFAFLAVVGQGKSGVHRCFGEVIHRCIISLIALKGKIRVRWPVGVMLVNDMGKPTARRPAPAIHIDINLAV